MKSFLFVEIASWHKNSAAVISLVNAFTEAGKISPPHGRAISEFSYMISREIPAGQDITHDDLKQLRDLGAEAMVLKH